MVEFGVDAGFTEWVKRNAHALLNPDCQFLALLGAHHILHLSRIRVKKKEG
jgi:hypothetical protein